MSAPNKPLKLAPQKQVERTEVTWRRPGSLNHACDSNLWMADEIRYFNHFSPFLNRRIARLKKALGI